MSFRLSCVVSLAPQLACCSSSSRFTSERAGGALTIVACAVCSMRDVTGVSMTSAGLVSAGPQLALALLTTAGAVLADWLRASSRLSTGAVRRLMHTFGTSCNAVLLLLVGSGLLEGIPEPTVVAVLALAVGVAGLTVGGGFNVNHLDILPTAAGAIATTAHAAVEALMLLVASAYAGTAYPKRIRSRRWGGDSVKTQPCGMQGCCSASLICLGAWLVRWRPTQWPHSRCA